MLHCRLAVRFFSLDQQLQSPLLTAVEAGQESATSFPSAEGRSPDRLTVQASLCTATTITLPQIIPHDTIHLPGLLKSAWSTRVFVLDATKRPSQRGSMVHW